jgi:hypothetical protein
MHHDDAKPRDEMRDGVIPSGHNTAQAAQLLVGWFY